MSATNKWTRASSVALLLALGSACSKERVHPGEAPCVEDPDAGVVCYRIHAAGVRDPGHPEFHGTLIRSLNYDFEVCAKCHGADFAGVGPAVSCLSCHEQGPKACITCHKNLPEQGAHRKHLLGQTVATSTTVCATCHRVPESVTTVGHILLADGTLDPKPPEIHFGPAASRGAPPEDPPRFEVETKSCKGVYCHGGRLNDSGALVAAPSWDEKDELGCSRCHGFPPPRTYHPNATCENCHPRVASGDGTIRDPALHIDQKIDVGTDGLGGCDSCHPQVVDQPQHKLHLVPVLGTRGPMTCADCHQMPATVGDPGHIDAPPVEVFPPGFDGLAAARGAQPSWDGQRCNNSYCHGQGSELVWVAGTRQVYCGSCHALPTSAFYHLPTFEVTDCHGCHPDSVDEGGNAIITVTGTTATSKHVNGIADVRQ